MTVPVAGGNARRTVRVAVALVAGQVALCAVIGYLTLGVPHGHSGGLPVASVPLAGGPIVVPPVAVAPPSTRAAPVPPRHTAAPPVRPPSPPAAAPHRAGVPATSPVPVRHGARSTAPSPTPPTPPPSGLFGTPSASPGNIQHDVTLGDYCAPLGADGLTSDGIAVRCARGGDGMPRWQLA